MTCSSAWQISLGQAECALARIMGAHGQTFTQPLESLHLPSHSATITVRAEEAKNSNDLVKFKIAAKATGSHASRFNRCVCVHVCHFPSRARLGVVLNDSAANVGCVEIAAKVTVGHASRFKKVRVRGFVSFSSACMCWCGCCMILLQTMAATRYYRSRPGFVGHFVGHATLEIHNHDIFFGNHAVLLFQHRRFLGTKKLRLEQSTNTSLLRNRVYLQLGVEACTSIPAPRPPSSFFFCCRYPLTFSRMGNKVLLSKIAIISRNSIWYFLNPIHQGPSSSLLFYLFSYPFLSFPFPPPFLFPAFFSSSLSSFFLLFISFFFSYLFFFPCLERFRIVYLGWVYLVTAAGSLGEHLLRKNKFN